MALTTRIWLLLIIAFWQVGCTTVQHISNTKVGYDSISTTTTTETDAGITAMIVPYKEKLDDLMNEVLANIKQEMVKTKPSLHLAIGFLMLCCLLPLRWIQGLILQSPIMVD